jgi:NAD(P)-dependent dehydrogenase (short-subunit alcohol dehydrogenase family)
MNFMEAFHLLKNSLELTGKVALITGGAQGIGLETARELGRLGSTVIIGARNLNKLEAAINSLRSEGILAESLHLDITLDKDRQAAHDYISQRHGKLDILINNAGVWKESQDASIAPNRTSTVPTDILHETFEANFFAPILLTQVLLPLIRKSPAGRIVNLASIVGSLTLHSDAASAIYDSKAFAYNASKTALNAFTVHLAHELLETPIKVNSAHPGWVRSEMGSSKATLNLTEGSITSVQLATLPADGPTGGFFFMNE